MPKEFARRSQWSQTFYIVMLTALETLARKLNKVNKQPLIIHVHCKQQDY